MLAKDVESHAMQLAGCESSFREANLKCILEMDRRNKAELMGTASSSEVGTVDIGYVITVCRRQMWSYD